jgi:hypothetical protein
MSKAKPRKSPIADLVRALNKDEEYRIVWQSALAMAFFDNYHWHMKRKRRPSRVDLYDIGNKAASYFLAILTRPKSSKRAKSSKDVTP